MRRGFIASRMSRSRSITSRPFSKGAPLTSTWSASVNWRLKLRAEMPRCRKVFPSFSLFRPSSVEDVLLDRQRDLVRRESGERDRDLETVLVETFDVGSPKALGLSRLGARSDIPGAS
jgi:hypothetical protein